MLTSQTIHKFAGLKAKPSPRKYYARDLNRARRAYEAFIAEVQTIDPVFLAASIHSFVLSGEPTAAASAQELVDQLREFYGYADPVDPTFCGTCGGGQKHLPE